jgi:hypothetical protein
MRRIGMEKIDKRRKEAIGKDGRRAGGDDGDR